jgi:hypothetical protein
MSYIATLEGIEGFDAAYDAAIDISAKAKDISTFSTEIKKIVSPASAPSKTTGIAKVAKPVQKKPDLRKFKLALAKLRKRPVAMSTVETVGADKPKAKTNALLIGGGIAAALVAGLLYFR